MLPQDRKAFGQAGKGLDGPWLLPAEEVIIRGDFERASIPAAASMSPGVGMQVSPPMCLAGRAEMVNSSWGSARVSLGSVR